MDQIPCPHPEALAIAVDLLGADLAGAVANHDTWGDAIYWGEWTADETANLWRADAEVRAILAARVPR